MVSSHNKKKKNGIMDDDDDDDDPLPSLPRSKWERSVALKCANVSRTGHFVNAQGMKIRWYAWDAFVAKTTTTKKALEEEEEEEEEEIGVVVGTHGSGAHAMFEWLQSTPMGTPRNKYKNSWIEMMNKKGLTFYAYDTQGAGRSDCARGCKAFVERESDMMEDNARFMELVRRKHDGGFSSRSGDDDDDDATRKRSRSRRSRKDTTGRKRRRRKKVFAAGVSMGGFTVARAAIEYPHLYSDGVVLLCPMLSLKRLRAHASNRLILRILRLFSIFTPTWEIGKTHKNKKFPLCQKALLAFGRSRHSRENGVRMLLWYRTLKQTRGDRKVYPPSHRVPLGRRPDDGLFRVGIVHRTLSIER